MGPQIPIPSEQIAAFCHKHHIRRLALFGSVLRDDFTPDSDVDVLVEFDPGHIPGFAFFRMEEELSGMIGRKVDLNTAKDLSPYFRDEVMQEADSMSRHDYRAQRTRVGLWFPPMRGLITPALFSGGEEGELPAHCIAKSGTPIATVRLKIP